MKSLLIKSPWTSAILWGLTGGFLMLICYYLPFDVTWEKEIPMIVSFVGCLIGLALTIKVGEHHKKFLTVFLALVIVWMLIPVTAHTFFAIKNGGIDFPWVIAFFQMLGIGVVFCAPLAFLTIKLRKRLTYT